MNKRKITSSLALSAVLLSTFIPATLAADTADTSSKVKGRATAGEFWVEADDANFGPLTIGKGIENTKADVRVLDNTGGAGWDLTVKSMNYDKVNKSLVEKVKLDNFDEQFLGPEDNQVASGDSRLAQFNMEATYSATWGVAPEAGNVENDLMWTLTPEIVTTTADVAREHIRWGFSAYPHLAGHRNPGTTPTKVGNIVVINYDWSNYINEDNELNLKFDLSEYGLKEGPTQSDLNNYNNEVSKYGMPELKVNDGVNWLFDLFYGNPIFNSNVDKDSPIQDFKSLIEEKDDNDGDGPWTGDFRILRDGTVQLADLNSPSLYLIGANNLEPTIKRPILIKFKDGSELNFTMNLTADGELLSR